jgi:hypothetical protein
MLFASVVGLGVNRISKFIGVTSSPSHAKGRQNPPNEIWREIKREDLAYRIEGAAPASSRIYSLDSAALVETLNRAPMEFTRSASVTATILPLPMPDGSLVRFRIEQSPVIEPALAAVYPNIKSYRGQGIDDAAMTMRCDWSSRGFNAVIISNGRTIEIHPARWDDTANYVSYSGQELDGVSDEYQCLVKDIHAVRPGRMNPQLNTAVGPTLRTFRIAIATTQEYTNSPSLGGGSVASTIASINTWLNGANAIYEKELSVRLTLVGNNSNVIYTAEPDPFTNGDVGAMISQVPAVLSSQIGSANYDIGHVLGSAASGGAGVAYVGVVCDNGPLSGGQFKGGAATIVSAPVGNSPALGVWVHELGHQFGATHSFNGTTGNCGGGNRSAASAWESGSGLTIMSYVGICGSDNIATAREMRFHAGSFAQITDYLINDPSGSVCAATSATGNNAPTVNGGSDYTIPRNTPFTLTATGSDADAGDVPNLTYVWEQLDAGGASYFNPPYTDAGDPITTTRPIFRPFSPVPSPSRTFPSLTYILNNANAPPATIGGLQTAENLPNVSRSINFRVTVRDNRAGGGGVNDDSALITVNGGAGPFLVTAPNTAVSWSGGSAQTVTWSVNGTSGAPINCANVKISLSTDGGNSFPTVLAASTPNDGSESVNIPNGIITSAARIKVEAIGNIFFDISDANFSISPGDGCPGVSSISPAVGHPGASVTITGANFTGVTAVKFSNNINAAFTINSNTQITATVPAGASTGPITISKSGCADTMTTVFTVCPNPPATLSIDDGTFEFTLGYGTGSSTSVWVNRLTPPSYPATLSAVVANINLAAGTNIGIVVGTNTDGDPNINNTAFQTLNTTVVTQNAFVTYNVTPVTINSGDFIIGFSFVPVSGVFPARIDDSSGSQGRSYASNSGTTFTTLDALGFPGNLGLRAVVYTGACNSGVPCPTITVAPATLPDGTGGAAYSQTVSASGGTAPYTFSITAGSLPAGLMLNSTNGAISGTPSSAGTSNFTITATDANNCSGNQGYSVTICGPPAISTHPANQAVCPGSPALFSVAATGTGLSYQWRKGGGNIAGATSSSYSIASVTAADAGSYDVVITGTCGTVTSNAATLTINPSTTITSQPSGQTVCAGNSATFSVTATGSGLNYQWRKNGANIAGATSSSYTIASAATADTGTYDVVVVGCDTVTSNAATLTVNPSTTITTHPASQTRNLGDSATFSVTAAGTGLAYQWRRNGVNIAGATSSNFTIGSVTSSDAGNYDVVITGACGNATSDVAVLTVNTSINLVYYPLPFPVRLLDTRPGEQGCFAPGVPLGNNAVRTQQATGTCNGLTIPANAKAIVGNATVVNFISTGFHWITLYPSDAQQPNSSNLNFSDNQIVPNNFTVGLGPDGAFNIYSHASTHFIVDVTGYYAPPGAGGLYYHPLPFPVRLFESRPGENGCDAPGAPLGNDATRTVLAHRTCLGATIPSSAKAIVGNATVVNFISTGFHWITLYPFGQPQPNVSNLNFHENHIVPNWFVVGLSSDGKSNIYSHAATHFIVDVAGYFSEEAVDANGQGLLYTALSKPVRLLETRPGEQGCTAPGVPLGNDATLTQSAHGTCFGETIPSAAKAVVGNATVVNFISTGFHWITLYPFGVTQPNASNLNFNDNQIVPNAFWTGLSSDGKFNIYSHGSTHFIVDLTGYFAP